MNNLTNTLSPFNTLSPGGKEQEIQHSVQEAIEVAQRDERKIICEYDEQIMEMQRELRLREDDMLELRQETEKQMDKLIAEKEQVEKEYQDQITSSEQLYNERLEDLVKRHEAELMARLLLLLYICFLN